MAKQTDVSTKSAEVMCMLPDWQLVSDLMGGTEAMRNAGRRRLPQEPGEQNQAYIVRLNRTTLFNAFKKTVRSLVGKPFSRPIHIADDMPERYVEYAEDIDLQGHDINSFAREVFTDVLADGLAHIMVEMPPKPDSELTLADTKDNARRPYAVQIDPRNIVGWKSSVVNGVTLLTQLRVMECVSVENPADEFNPMELDQIRVYDIGGWRLFRQLSTGGTTSKKWQMVEQGAMVDANGNALTVIPLVTIYARREMGFMCAEPPLLDLAYLNVQHWQNTSDQENILHIARVPVLFGKGFPVSPMPVPGIPISSAAGAVAPPQKPKIEISAQRGIFVNDPGADLKWVETTGEAIGAGQTHLESIEDRMSVIGLDLLVRRRGAGSASQVTATEKSLDAKEQDSDLAAMVTGLRDGLEHMFMLMAMWEGEDEDFAGSLSIHTDFGINEGTGADLQWLIQLYQNQAITLDLLLREFQRRNAIDSSVDIDAVVEELKNAGPSFGSIKGAMDLLDIVSGADPNAAGDAKEPPAPAAKPGEAPPPKNAKAGSGEGAPAKG